MIIKATLLLALGLGLSALVRSAAARHLIWGLALSGTLLLPALEPMVPSLRVPISIAGSPPPDEPARAGERAVPVEEASAAAPVPIAAPSQGFPRAVSGAVDLRRLAMGTWAIGALLIILFIGAGHLALAGMVRRGAPVSDPAWLDALHRAAAAVGVTVPVRLIQTPRVRSPMVWGFRRPVVLLPVDAGSWPAERRRAVLEHEMAHVARNDATPQLIAGLACALHWFNPLVWLAARRLRSDGERACDDLVLRGGMSGAEYAAHLLEVARGARTLRLAGLAAIGMARPSQLEGRLLAALDAARPRWTPSTGTRRVAWAALALLVTPLAAIRPVTRTAQEREPGSPVERDVTGGTTATITTSTPARPTSPPAAASEASQDRDSVIEREVNASAGETLTLDLGPGGTVNLQGWDRPMVRVTARLGGMNWRDTRLEVEREPGGVRVHARQAVDRDFTSTNHSFDIRVPRRFDVSIRSGGGGLTIVDVEGTFRGHTGGGELNIERAAGWADLSTGGGDIEVRDSDLRGSVSTGGGRVLLSRVPRELRGSSGSGPVMYRDAGGDRTGDLTVAEGRRGDVRLRAGGGGVLHMEKAGGDIDLDEAPDGADVRTGGGRIRIGPSAGTVKASTGGGDIEIGPVAGSVEAGTGAGDVVVTLAPAGGADQSVEISAGVGSVVIELPAGFAGQFDLETAYTENFEHRTVIESDWALEHSETDRWDRRQGTPRKYVRARGTAGTGGGLVRVRTVNGDITIRRTD